jgi:hypothetical protein
LFLVFIVDVGRMVFSNFPEDRWNSLWMVVI